MTPAPDPAVVLAYVGVLLGEARRTAGRWPVTAEAAYRLSSSWPTLADSLPGNGSGDDVLLVDLAEAGRRLGGVSESTVRRAIQRGDLPAVVLGDRPMVLVDDLKPFARSQPSPTWAGRKEKA